MYFNAGYSYANLAEIDMSWLILTQCFIKGVYNLSIPFRQVIYHEDLRIEESTKGVYNSRKRKIETQGME